MFDIFTKSRIKLTFASPGLSPVRPGRLDTAWRVYRAIDRALKIVEAERQFLRAENEHVENSDAASVVGNNGGNIENPFADHVPKEIGRTKRLDDEIAYYKLLKTALLIRFPEFDLREVRSWRATWEMAPAVAAR